VFVDGSGANSRIILAEKVKTWETQPLLNTGVQSAVFPQALVFKGSMYMFWENQAQIGITSSIVELRPLTSVGEPIVRPVDFTPGVPANRDSVTVSWTAPGDDSLTGTAKLYDVRFSTAPITSANFTAAVQATGAPTPLPAGTSQSMLVTGLSPATAYWFALKTIDDAGNWSGISNIVQWSTPAASDTIRPAPLAVSVTATGAEGVWPGARFKSSAPASAARRTERLAFKGLLRSGELIPLPCHPHIQSGKQDDTHHQVGNQTADDHDGKGPLRVGADIVR